MLSNILRYISVLPDTSCDKFTESGLKKFLKRDEFAAAPARILRELCRFARQVINDALLRFPCCEGRSNEENDIRFHDLREIISATRWLTHLRKRDKRDCYGIDGHLNSKSGYK